MQPETTDRARDLHARLLAFTDAVTIERTPTVFGYDEAPHGPAETVAELEVRRRADDRS